MNTFLSFRLRVPQRLFEAMLEQARRELPNECCGLLAGRPGPAGATGEVTHRYPLVNELTSPTAFVSEARGMLAAVKDMRAHGTDVLAVYHSHPASPPVPSRRDLECNYSPEVVNLIIGLGSAAPEVRAWWLIDAEFREAEWEVVADSGSA